MRILCLGDSITASGRLFDDIPLGNGYVQQLSQLFSQQNSDFKWINKGIDGFTAARLLEHAVPEYLPLHPDIITILIGINDVGLMMNTNRTTDQKEAMMQKFFHTYDKLVQYLFRSCRQIILIEPFVLPPPAEYLHWLPVVRAMSHGIQSLSKKYGLPFLPLQDLLFKHAKTTPVVTDGIHLTPYGHQLLAHMLYCIFNHFYV